MRAGSKYSRVFTIVLCIFIASATAVLAQEDEADPVFKQEELDQMLAPIALYPDSLLTQILMASTYPLDVVQADRWAGHNKGMSSDDMAKALEAQPWDPSVKSLVNFPQVLAMMSEKLDWTQKLGEAFTVQQKEVLDTVQKLREKAQEAGNLKTTDEQVVKVEKETIIIEPANPEVVYVPTYNPTVIYGPWWYPDYLPYYYYPPGYVGGSYIAFGSGVSIGFAWGYAWGYPNWRGRDIVINVNRNINFNPFINRDRYSAQYREGHGQWKWRATPSQQVQERRVFRGYSGSGSVFTPREQPFQQRTQQIQPREMRQPFQQRSQQAPPQSSIQPFQPRRSVEQGFSPFSGLDRGGSSMRDFSNRGASSRQAAPIGGRGGSGAGRWR